MSETGLAARSRAYFAERYPELAARLARRTAVESSVVISGGEPVDIRVEDRLIYGGDARRFARSQVDAFMAKPLRLYVNQLSDSGLVSPICVRMLRAFEDYLREAGQDEVATYPSGSPSFLVVFGLGLGHHLMELAERTEAKWLVIVEPLLEFLEHSVHVVDWQALVETFERRGGTVEIIVDIDPGLMTAAISRTMSRHGIPYADGSWVFTHYPLWAFGEARKRLYEALEFAFINRGFFEDELRMLGNAVENFAGRDFRLLEGRPRLRRAETAAIVGAGPSLDECIDTLHRIRDQVVLFSCGTGLRPLLKNGIIPDFHCELENVPEVVDAVMAAGAPEDLARITLIASATVDPRVPPLFGETIFYFRDAVSSTQILGQKYRVIPATSPTCVNMGLSMAAFMGFTDFVLFGTDCGIRPGGKRHAEGTVYRDIGIFQKSDRNRDNPIEVEGNFGGVARTDWVYDASRIMLAGAIAHYRLNVVNCSDGALIPGARPRVPEALEITGPAVDRASFAATLGRSMPRFAPGAILADADLDEVEERILSLYARIHEILGELAAGEPDFVAAYDAMTGLVGEAKDVYGYTESVIQGTLNALPRIAMFYGFRVPDGSIRRGLHALMIAEIGAIVDAMVAETRALFVRLKSLLPPARQEASIGI